MDWRWPSDNAGWTDPNGLERLMAMLSDAFGAPVPATSFTFDADRMRDASREIEESASGHLLVGFQDSIRLDGEEGVYRDLTDRGVRVTAFGTGQPSTDLPLTWIETPADRTALENQWFLVADGPGPRALVGYELSDPESFGRGTATDPRRRFAGFTTEEPALIAALTTHLRGVASRHAPPPAA